MREVFAIALMASVTAGCGAGAKEGKDCEYALDCNDGLVCVAYGESAGTCNLDCSASADECGAEASCSGVGTVGIDVCQDSDKVVTEDNPAEGEDDIPYIPCLDDAECRELGGGSRMVCGEWMGMRQCTLSCESEEQCSVVPGIDFFTCLEDEGKTSRDICAPDMSCFTDPMACMDLGTEFPDFPGF